jgi:hypothetical protein
MDYRAVERPRAGLLLRGSLLKTVEPGDLHRLLADVVVSAKDAGLRDWGTVAAGFTAPYPTRRPLIRLFMGTPLTA